MSKFFGESNASSDSDESDSDDEQTPMKADRLAHVSSESEEEEKRIVRSARDKRFEEMQNIVRNMKNHKNIKDIAMVCTDFEDLTKSFIKAKKIVDAEGIPKFYTRAVAELDDFVNEVWENKKDLSKTMAKSLNNLKQKVKKYNRDFENQIKDFREHPENYNEEEEAAEVDADEVPDRKTFKDESDDDLSHDQIARIPVAKLLKPTVPPGKTSDDEDDDDEEWPESSDESSSSEDMEMYKDDPAARFLKKTVDTGKDKDKKDKKDKKPTKVRPTKRAAEERPISDDDKGWINVDITGRPERVHRAFEKDQEVTLPVVIKKLDEVLSNRGRKGTDRNSQIGLLADIEAKVVDLKLGAGLQAKVLVNLIAAVFDYNSKQESSIPTKNWEQNLRNISRLMDLLEANVDTLTLSLPIVTYRETESTEELELLQTPPYRVNGLIIPIVERMDDEYTKILQNVDAHSQEYVEKLRDEQFVCRTIDRLCDYTEKKNATKAELCTAYQLKIEHLYYKFDYEWARRVEQWVAVSGEEVILSGNTSAPVSESYLAINKLCRFAYSEENVQGRIRTRAILCHIYFLALHDYWFEARDLMFMSNLQMLIDKADPSTMILYNRAMVQLGLCAFRKGYIKEAHQALVDLQSSPRVKELLAQGLVPSRQERTPDEEKIERLRQIPYHMHINLELLECVYLVSAMLLEIPYIAAHEMDLRRRMISKNFHHVLKSSERQTLVGPPETMRDHVVAASKAMRCGNWRATVRYIINPKMNGKVWDLFFQSDKVKQMLVNQIKEEALRTYLFTYSSVFDSIGLDKLANHFELDKAVIYSIVSKMIINEELLASLEEPTSCLIMHRTETSRLQTLALQLAEKVNGMLELNEKLTEVKQPSMGGSKGQSMQQGQRRQNRYGPSKGMF